MSSSRCLLSKSSYLSLVLCKVKCQHKNRHVKSNEGIQRTKWAIPTKVKTNPVVTKEWAIRTALTKAVDRMNYIYKDEVLTKNTK